MANNIVELRRERGATVDEMAALNRLVGNREMTTDESEKWNRLDKRQNELKQIIDRAEQTGRLDAEMNTPANHPGPEIFGPAPDSSWSGSFNNFFPQNRASNFSASYRSLFPQTDTGINEYRFFDDLAREVASGRTSDRLQRLNNRAMTIDPGSSGGYLVPEQLTSLLYDNALENEIVRPRATVYPMASSNIKVPKFDGYDHTSGTYGGWTPAWVGEDGTLNITAAKYEQQSLTAYKLYLFGQVSRELYSDAPGIGDAIQKSMTKALGFTLDDAFFNGTGAGMPRGLLNSPCLIEVAKESDQSSDTILYLNLVNMWARLHPSCASNAIWVAHPSTVTQLLSMVQTTGTYSGSPVPIFNPATGGYQIFGRPLLLTEKIPALGDAGDIILVDLSQYLIGMRQEMIVDQTDAYEFNRDRISIRVLVRCDGQMGWSSAVTLENGTASVGPLVTLAAR